MTGQKRGIIPPNTPKFAFFHFSARFTQFLTVFDALNEPDTYQFFVSITLYPGDQKSQYKYGKINCPLFVDAPLFSVFCVF